MVTVVYCTREHNQTHIDHLIKSSGLKDKIEVIEIINKGKSLTKAYNKGLKDAKNDIVVFCHDDLTMNTKMWGSKIVKLFNKNPEFGIIGVAGTKLLSESGTWWDDLNRTYGRVTHSMGDITWDSNYSKDLGQVIEEVVVCDGVWLAVNKSRIKKEFDETIKGFHFYDVDFTFQNFIAGVKVGVTTIINVTHKSKGDTDEEWEKNRLNFIKKNKTLLPVKIDRVLRKGERLNILIGCLSFRGSTDSETYVYELVKGLVKEGHKVSICAHLGDPMRNKMMALTKTLKIDFYSLQEPPNYKLGDGKWVLKSPDGEEVSIDKNLYRLDNKKFDLLHLNHNSVTNHLIRLYPDTPIICTIHSSEDKLEEPVISEQIKTYIATTPEIKEHLITEFKIDDNKISEVNNIEELISEYKNIIR